MSMQWRPAIHGHSKLLWIARLTSLGCALALIALASQQGPWHSAPSSTGRKELIYRETQVVLITQLTPRAARPEGTLPEGTLPEGTATVATTDERLQASTAARQPGTSGFRALVTTQTAADMLPVAAPNGKDFQSSRPEAQPPSPKASPLQQPLEPLQPRDQYMALCLAVKDEAVEVKYWVKYHARLGVGKFYVFDEGKQSMAEDLREEIAAGLVEYKQLPEPRGQLPIYGMCLAHPQRLTHKFMGFIDVDEFLVIKDRSVTDLPTLLKRFEGKGGVAVNWRLFGSSGHLQKPAGPVTDNYWQCLPAWHLQSRQIKSIVSTEEVTAVGPDPHTFLYKEGKRAETTTGELVKGAKTEGFAEDQLVLYHYVTKSKEEFERKMARGSGMGNHRNMDFLKEMDREATDACMDLFVR